MGVVPSWLRHRTQRLAVTTQSLVVTTQSLVVTTQSLVVRTQSLVVTGCHLGLRTPKLVSVGLLRQL
jgi:hypothetical protein